MILKENTAVRFRWIGVIICLFFLLGITSFTQILTRYDQKNRMRDILNKGNYLVSLIALHPLEDLNGEKSDFFLRTLTEYVSSEGLAYCFIHDPSGHSILSLAPRELASKIPNDIQTRSLYTKGLTKQRFRVSGRENTFFEFAKPVFEEGRRSGTVRLGLTIPPPSIVTLERIGLLAMIGFLIFSAFVLAYYGITSSLQPLRRLYHSLGSACTGVRALPAPNKKGSMSHIIQDIEQSFFQLRETLEKTETDNMEMATRLGVTTFEKNQILKIIDSINFGIIITDIQDNINYINTFMLSLTGKTREETVDCPLTDIIENNDVISFISQQGSLKSNNATKHIETTFPDFSSGGIFQVSFSYMRDGDGSLVGKMISIKDVAKEKASDKAKHEFIANVAHEFLTPLTTIKSYNEMLMDGEIDDTEMQKEFYNTIGEETGRLSRLIQNLLSLSKIEMGSLTLNSGLVKTDWLVQDSLGAVETPARDKNITITSHLPDQFPNLIGDKELLKTAIINILGNAVKYSPENSQITFSLTEEDDMVVFDIIDTGHGISEEDLPHIFDRFYRSRESHIVEQTGSGLGLAMTLEIIQLHGGEIEVESETGQGTQFCVRIPREEYYLGES